MYFRPRVMLELVNARLVGAEGDPMKKLADMQLNEGLVVGDVLDDWDGSDFSKLTASLICGGTAVIDGKVDVPGGSAIGALQLFLDHVGDHCGGLKAGPVVITGSLSGLSYFVAGTSVSGKIARMGEVGCRLI